MEKLIITIETAVKAPVDLAWKCWTSPGDVMKWNFASDDWHCPKAENDFRIGGNFCYRMESNDGATGFDFEGTYLTILPFQQIIYSLGDDRQVKIEFMEEENITIVREHFEAETVHSPELQKAGWQNILDNFKKHTESIFTS